jgi:hypothetical protein
MLKSLAIPVVAFAAITVPASAQLIVGNDQANPTIYSIDVSTGVATPLHTSATGGSAEVWGMAYDAATNTLYWNAGATLYSSPLGPTLTPTDHGSIQFGATGIVPLALSFHNGKLYATRSSGPEGLYEVDPATFTATVLYQYPTSFDMGGLEHDASTGVLYGLTDATGAPSGRGLYSIDPIGMTTAFISPYPNGETDIDGLSAANGLAYLIHDGPNTVQTNFYVIDIATGLQVGTVPSPFTGSGLFSAGTWAGNSTPPPQSTPYCFGDGTGAACPCANTGAAGNGCASSVNANGANITTSGTPSLAADTLTLLGSGMPNASALYFQGTLQQGGGLGVPFGDGLRCVGGSIVRLKTVTNVAGSSQYPEVGDASVSVRGNIAAPGVRNYQVWYRNAASFCTAATFNLTNGVSVSWLP